MRFLEVWIIVDLEGYHFQHDWWRSIKGVDAGVERLWKLMLVVENCLIFSTREIGHVG